MDKLVFTDRVEIINPGHLPNHLTIANIKASNSNIRNPTMAHFLLNPGASGVILPWMHQ